MSKDLFELASRATATEITAAQTALPVDLAVQMLAQLPPQSLRRSVNAADNEAANANQSAWLASEKIGRQERAIAYGDQANEDTIQRSLAGAQTFRNVSADYKRQGIRLYDDLEQRLAASSRDYELEAAGLRANKVAAHDRRTAELVDIKAAAEVAQAAAVAIAPKGQLASAIGKRAEQQGWRGYWIAGAAGALALAGAVNLALAVNAEQHPSSIVQYDSSILPGSFLSHTPLALIPGTPDFPTYYGTVTIGQTNKLVMTTETVPSEHAGKTTAPLATGLQLSATEATADANLIDPIIQTLAKQQAVVESIDIHGSASDDPTIGQPDTANDIIAEARKDLAVKTVIAAAKQSHLKLPDIGADSSEAILNLEQQQQLGLIATEQHLNVNDLAEAYNKGTAHLTEAQREVFDTTLAQNRGIEIDIQLERTVHQQSNVVTEITRPRKIGERSGELLVAGYLIIGGYIGAGLGGRRTNWRLARASARRELRKVNR